MTKQQDAGRAPAFQFYPDDYLSDDAVEAMTLAEQGAYMRLLCHAWKSKRPGCLENDDDLLARLSRLGQKWAGKTKARILRAFLISEDGRFLIQKRMVRTHEDQARYRKQRQEAGREGATQRWGKTQGDDSSATSSPLANDSSASSSASAEEIKIPPGGGSASPTSSQPLPAKGQQPLLTVVEPPPPPDKKPKAPNAVGLVIQRYRSLWVELYKPGDGRPPALTKADRGQAAALAREHGVDQALAYLERYLGDRDPWLVEHCHPLASVTRQVNKYRATVQLPTRGRFDPPPPTKERRHYSRDVDDVLREQQARGPELSQAELRARQGAAT